MAPKANTQREGVMMNPEEVEQAINHLRANAPLIAKKVQAELDQLKKNSTPVVVSVLTPNKRHQSIQLQILGGAFNQNTHLSKLLQGTAFLSNTKRGTALITIPISVQQTLEETEQIFQMVNTVLSKMKL
jgi:hypothetical protein